MPFFLVKNFNSLRLENDDLLLRPLQKSDFSLWARTRAQSRDFLTPFEPIWGAKDLSYEVFLKRLKHNKRQMALKYEFSFSIWKKTGDIQILAGGLSLTNIRHISGHVNLGYWISVEQKNKGIMSAAVAMVLPFVFDDLALRRIHAASLPNNAASIAVLEKSGFIKEGFAKNYLQINGAWRDHLLYGLTVEEYKMGFLKK